MMEKSVLLLMSGGVTAVLPECSCSSRDITGGSHHEMLMWSRHAMSGCSWGCPDAKRCAALNIRHYTINTVSEFHQKVIAPFIKSYESGLTPNPCVRCNSFVRFEEAFDLARQWGCEYVATGHYARNIIDEDGEPHLHRALYREKDQSYYLYGIRRELLRNIRFPLGELTKDESRRIAHDKGLVTAKKAESQEICFTLGRPYTEFLAQHLKTEPGPIQDRQGNTLGTHEGVAHYTVGQRKGLGLSGGPYYVLELDPKGNRVIVGRREELGRMTLQATSVRWIHEPEVGEPVLGQIRSRHTPAPAVVTSLSPSMVEVEFDEPQEGGTRTGTGAVPGDEILGGGMIMAANK